MDHRERSLTDVPKSFDICVFFLAQCFDTPLLKTVWSSQIYFGNCEH